MIYVLTGIVALCPFIYIWLFARWVLGIKKERVQKRRELLDSLKNNEEELGWR